MQVPLEPAPPVRPVDVEHAHASGLDDQPERACPLDDVDIPFGPDGSSEEERAARITVAEVSLRMLDWMGEHKSTWESADGVWQMLRTFLPVETVLCVFSRVKRILVSHLNGRLRKIDVCPCAYTVYTDCQSEAFSDHMYQNAHRTQCPRPQCGLSRCVPGLFPPVARKVAYTVITVICRL
jgi:hypothetical protein